MAKIDELNESPEVDGPASCLTRRMALGAVAGFASIPAVAQPDINAPAFRNWLTQPGNDGNISHEARVALTSGVPGFGCNVENTLAAVKAAPLTNTTIFWAGVPFHWETKNAPYASDEKQSFVTTISSNHRPLSEGAWVRQNASSLSFFLGRVGSIYRSLLDKVQERASIKDFGAAGDGIVDDATQINAAFSSGIKRIYLPDGTYRIASPVEIDGDVTVLAHKGAKIVADPGVLEAIRIGRNALFVGRIAGLRLEKASFDGSTENVGFAYYNCAQATFDALEARYFKYPHRATPNSGQRVAYSVWTNAQAIGGYFNFSAVENGTGYCNENLFVGGRAFTTRDTHTNVHWPVGNHNRFIGLSAEGSGHQAFYVGGHSNAILHPRTEGKWVVDDIVVADDAIATTVTAWNLYTTVTDNGKSSSLDLHLQGLKRTIGLGGVPSGWFRRTGSSDSGVPVLEAEDLGSTGHGFGIRTRLGRYTAEGWHWLAQRAGDGSVVFRADALGTFTAARKLVAQQSDHTIGGWQIGSFNFFFDTRRTLRVKDGTPRNENDGNAIPQRVAVPKTSMSPGKPGDYALDDQYRYEYNGDGARHNWARWPVSYRW